MSKLKTLREKRATVYTAIDELRKAADGREMTAEEQTRWDTLLSDYEKADKLVEQEERFQEVERRQAEQTYESRHKPNEQDTNQPNEAEYRSAFMDYLMLGAMGITPESRSLFEKRAGITGLNGGVIVPKTLADNIEVALKSYGGMLEAGTIITTSTGGDLIMPTINDTTSKATVVAEYNQSTKKAPSFGSETLKAYTYRTPIVPVSQELLQDSSFDLESLLSGLLAESFGRGINEDLTIGSGTGKPKGIINWATASDAAPAATAIKLDDIIDLLKSVDSAYARNGRFMFNRETLWSLVKIKDTTGRYIWQEGAKDGTPPTLFGKGYILNDDVANIGAGNASMMFGDFSKFKIRMVKNFRVIRLNELLAEYLSIGLFGFARVDGALLDAGTHPVKKLVHASA
ncbi:phage major capsid protein [Bacteroides sp.]|uniref:phage major capsid protein n=1 Tax=Bacteroides sp. TaxID=29523 RepID=UPI00260EC37A|nr:phage major capsid protein [Bacteroides sp.]MDD3039487.1 phage major capsid protein [Bacteroides sp.]